MKVSGRLVVPLTLGCLALGGCQQPPLKSQLPTGDAAYQAINATSQPMPVTGSYLVRPGDHLAMSVYQEPDLTIADVPVDDSGTVSLPLVGEVRASGRSVGEISTEVQRAYGAKYLRNPQVNIRLLKVAIRTISVEGQVVKPGQFEVEPTGNTLLSAIALAGSPAETAKLDEVLVFRTVNGQRMGARFDLTAIRAGRSPDPQILPGDVVVVGFSQTRGLYRDFIQTVPVLGIFRVF